MKFDHLGCLNQTFVLNFIIFILHDRISYSYLHNDNHFIVNSFNIVAPLTKSVLMGTIAIPIFNKKKEKESYLLSLLILAKNRNLASFLLHF